MELTFKTIKTRKKGVKNLSKTWYFVVCKHQKTCQNHEILTSQISKIPKFHKIDHFLTTF